MGEIISFSRAAAEQKDEEDGVYAVREDDGGLKDIADWDATDWQGLFEEVFFPIVRDTGVSIYELIADFMGRLLADSGEPTEE